MIVKKRLITLFFIISATCYYFYLLDPNQSIVGIQLDDIALMSSALWGIFQWLEMRNKKNPCFVYRIWMVLLVLLVFLSAFQSNRLYGQPFICGLIPLRNQIVWALLYFPISKSLYYERINFEEIKGVVRAIGQIQLVLFIAQYILFGKFNFLNVTSGERYGSARLSFIPIVLDLLVFLEFDDLLINRKERSKMSNFISLITIIAIIFEVMVVQKLRLTTSGMCLCLMLGMIIARGSFNKKILYVVIVILACLILVNTTLFRDVISTLSDTTNSTISNTSRRALARELYATVLAQHPILGGGYPHSSWRIAMDASGQSRNLFLVDNGIMAFFYVYGGLGVIWFVSLWIKFIRIGLKTRKKKHTLVCLLFPIFLLITGINELHWYWMFGFSIMVIFLCISEFYDRCWCD